MKSILPYSILLFIAAAPLTLAASYSGAQIYNHNGSYDTTVSVSAASTSGSTGAVMINLDAGTTTTTLNGNITITNAGIGGAGVHLDGTGTNTVNLTATAGATGKNIVITTHKDGDGHGASAASATSTININSKDHNFVVQHSSGTASGSGVAVSAYNGGKVNITANEISLNYASTGDTLGIYTSGAASKITIATSTVYISSTAHALSTYNGGTIAVTGNVVATVADSTNAAIRTLGSGASAITVSGHTTLKGSMKYGVRAAAENSTINLNGGLTASSKKGAALSADGCVIYGYANGSVITDNASATVGTLYELTGRIATAGTAKVDLHMGAGSTFEGYTSKTAGTLNLALANAANWTLTESSVMDNLKLYSASSLNFKITSSSNFTNLNAASAMLSSGSVINVDLNGYTGVAGDSFQLITTPSLTASNLTYNLQPLSAGLNWDTSTFTTDGTIRILADVVPPDAVIPEPTTASLTLLGLTALMARRRRPLTA